MVEVLLSRRYYVLTTNDFDFVSIILGCYLYVFQYLINFYGLVIKILGRQMQLFVRS